MHERILQFWSVVSVSACQLDYEISLLLPQIILS